MLVVDDVGVRELPRRILSEKGYAVLEAQDPEGAMTIGNSIQARSTCP